MDEVAEKFDDVFTYILKEETDYRTRRIPLSTNWDWSMYEHLHRSFQLKNFQFTTGANDFSRPYKNIILPIANVNYRTEGFDVKDVNLFVNDKNNYHKSLLARKYHHRWAKKYSIDTAIDESVESYFDYGLILVKNVNEERPEVVDLLSLAFCDQTNILSGPICLKHNYSIDELLDLKGRWDSKAIDRVVLMSKFSQQKSDDKTTKTPGKYVEVYELHGVFPESWLGVEKLGEEWQDTGKYTPQIHIVTYYVGDDKNKNGISLYKNKEPKPIFKALKRDPIFGRACGRGGIEELFHPQIWTNYSEINLQRTLEAVSKVVLKTTDKRITQNNNLKNLKHNQVITLDDGKDISQLSLSPQNKTHFDNYVNLWEQNARELGSASDPQLGKNPVSGTPLGTTEIVVSQGQGVHEYRRGKVAVFWGEIYRDWVLKYLADEMNQGDKWLDELTVDELQEVAEKVATKQTNKRIKDIVLSNRTISEEARQLFKETIKQSFAKGGKKRFMELIKGEIKDIPLDVDFNIAGKQKDQFEMVNKLNAIFRTVFANPAILQNKGMADLFNQILEMSNLNPIDFTSLTNIGIIEENKPMPSPVKEELPVS